MAVQVSLASDPQGQPGVLIQWDHHWMVLPPQEARGLGNLILQLATQAETEAGPSW